MAVKYMLKNLHLTRKFKNNSDLIFNVCLVLVIFIFLNFFSYNFFVRYDLTGARLYSISPATKQILKDLPDPVNVKVYFSDNLPSQFLPVRQALTDVLDEYRGYAKNFQVQYIDPKDGVEAEAAGIPKLQFNDIRQDKLEVVNGYMGLVIGYRNKQEVIPVAQNVANFEYELTSRLKKLIGDLPTVGFVSDQNASDFSNDFSLARQEISKLYKVETVSLSNIPEAVETLVIVGSSGNFNDSELQALDDFLMRGGAVIALVDGMTVGPDLRSADNQGNILAWLNLYGIKVNNDLVADASAGLASFNQGVVTFSLAYPYWPLILNKNFAADNPLVAGLDGVVLPWASSLDVARERMAEEAQVDVLAKSSQQAWRLSGSFDLSPNQPFAPNQPAGQYDLAILLSGTIKSPYDGRSTDQGRLFVVGDSDFVQDNFWRGNPANLVFLHNLIDGASLGADLIHIRAKQIDNRSLDTAGVNTDVWRYLNIFGLTFVTVVCGLVRYYFRKKTKEIEI